MMQVFHNMQFSSVLCVVDNTSCLTISCGSIISYGEQHSWLQVERVVKLVVA